MDGTKKLFDIFYQISHRALKFESKADQNQIYP